MANKKVTDFTAAASADLTNSSTLTHLVNPDRVSASERNLKATRAQMQTYILADGVVDSAALAVGSVTTAKIPDDTINQDHLQQNSVGQTQLRTESVSTAKLAAGAVTTAKLEAGAVREEQLYDGAVTAVKLASGAVTAGKLDSGAVTPSNTNFFNQAANAKIYFGKVTAGSQVLPSGWAYTDNGTGNYRITHSFGDQNYVFVATPANGGALTALPASNWVTVNTYVVSTGAATDADFTFICIRY